MKKADSFFTDGGDCFSTIDEALDREAQEIVSDFYNNFYNEYGQFCEDILQKEGEPKSVAIIRQLKDQASVAMGKVKKLEQEYREAESNEKEIPVGIGKLPMGLLAGKQHIGYLISIAYTGGQGLTARYSILPQCVDFFKVLRKGIGKPGLTHTIAMPDFVKGEVIFPSKMLFDDVVEASKSAADEMAEEIQDFVSKDEDNGKYDFPIQLKNKEGKRIGHIISMSWNGNGQCVQYFIYTPYVSFFDELKNETGRGIEDQDINPKYVVCSVSFPNESDYEYSWLSDIMSAINSSKKAAARTKKNKAGK
jgi:hypothetical protein